MYLPVQVAGLVVTHQTRDKVHHIQGIFDFDEADRKTNDLDKLDNLDRVDKGGHQEEGRSLLFSVWPSPC